MEKGERLYGLDLLKTVSMILVVAVHMSGIGGAINVVSADTPQYNFTFTVYAFSFCAVNCYAMLSGYTGRAEKIRPAKFLNLWTGVFFWSAAIYAVAVVRGHIEFSAIDLIRKLLPVLSKQYWYFSAYAVLFFIQPALNRELAKLSQRAKLLFMTGVLIAGGAVPMLIQADPFEFFNGYTVIWIVVMYIFGNCLREIEITKETAVVSFLTAVASTLVTVASKNLITAWNLTHKYQFQPNYFFSYTAPCVVVCAASLIILFASFKIKKGGRIFTNLSQKAFGVYLIHTHPLFFAHIGGVTTAMASYPPAKYVLAFSILVFRVFFTCLALEYARSLLFRLTRINRLTEIVSGKIGKKQRKPADAQLPTE